MAEVGRFWERHPRLLKLVWGTTEPVPSVDREKEFLLLAAALGIARPLNMLKYYSHPSNASGRDIDWAIGRFKQVSNLTNDLLNHAQKVNPELNNQFVPKYRDGRAGKYEPQNVPESYYYECPFVSTPAGWAGPRLLALAGEDQQQVLDDSLQESTNPAIFLCVLAENVYSTGVASEEIIDLVLKRHIMEEQNTKSMYLELLRTMAVTSPELYRATLDLYESKICDKKQPGWVSIMTEYLDQ
jgi:hypothetical protein